MTHDKGLAVVTGASRGLGRAIASALVRSGYRLVLTARSADALEKVAQELRSITSVDTIGGDIRDPQFRLTLQQRVAQLGGANVLINNAGILGPSPRPLLLNYGLDALREVFDANVVAQLGVIQALQSVFLPGVRILNISSDAAVTAYAGWGGYGASKAALELLTAVLREENPELLIYTVDPGDLRTQMHQEAFPGEDISDRPLPEVAVPGLLRLLEADLPGGRYQAQTLGQEVQNVR